MLSPWSWEKHWFRLQMVGLMIGSAFQHRKSIIKTFYLLRDIIKKYRGITDMPPFVKVAKIGGRFFWRQVNPGYPSQAIKKVLQNEMNRIDPHKPYNGLRALLIGITKKCPYDCEHCFEWFNLNEKETLSIQDLIRLVRSWQDFGTTQITFGGGEPMVRIKDLYKVLETVRPGTDFWIFTSGFGFTKEHAHKLKAAGLTGVAISIDHHEAEKHDQFRGYSGAFEAAIQACIAAKEAGLVVAISLCVRPDYVTKENIQAYLELGRKLGVCFVQFIEARSTGRYQGKHLALPEKQIALLKQFYKTYNTQSRYWDYPLITWPDQQRRNVGCLAGGRGFFYIDTDGDAHSCPFCQTKVCSTLTHSAPEVIDKLKQSACHVAGFSNI